MRSGSDGGLGGEKSGDVGRGLMSLAGWDSVPLCQLKSSSQVSTVEQAVRIPSCADQAACENQPRQQNEQPIKKQYQEILTLKIGLTPLQSEDNLS